MEALEGIPECLQFIRPKGCTDRSLESAHSGFDWGDEPVPIPEVVGPRMESAEHRDGQVVPCRVPHNDLGGKLGAHRRLGSP